MADPTVEVRQVGNEEDYHFFYNPWKKAIVVNENDAPTNPLKLFLTRPLYAPLLFPNVSSDARDHAANERTYLSYLRLAVYLAVVAVAIFINFHLKHQPTEIEQRISHPLGITFCFLALCCLVAGFANYVRTVAKYARKAALVQSGLKTQLIFGVTACAIIAACGVFLGAEAQRNATRKSITSLSRHRTDMGPYDYQALLTERLLQERILQVLSDAAGGVSL